MHLHWPRKRGVRGEELWINYPGGRSWTLPIPCNLTCPLTSSGDLFSDWSMAPVSWVMKSDWPLTRVPWRIIGARTFLDFSLLGSALDENESKTWLKSSCQDTWPRGHAKKLLCGNYDDKIIIVEQLHYSIKYFLFNS